MAEIPSTTKKSNTSSGYAIIESSGQQFWVEADRYYDFDRINADIDQKITIDKVLLINDGNVTTFGNPYIEGANVKIKVLAHRRGKKIIVYKMRPKKKTRRKNGHRQELTRVMIESISIKKKSTQSTSTTAAKSTAAKSTAAKSTAAKSTAAKSTAAKSTAAKSTAAKSTNSPKSKKSND